MQKQILKLLGKSVTNGVIFFLVYLLISTLLDEVVHFLNIVCIAVTYTILIFLIDTIILLVKNHRNNKKNPKE